MTKNNKEENTMIINSDKYFHSFIKFRLTTNPLPCLSFTQDHGFNYFFIHKLC